MKHKLFYPKLQRTSSHRISLMKNMSKSLFEHKSIITTKPKADSLISFISRFITRLIKKTSYIEAYRYINKNISGKEKTSVKSIIDFYTTAKENPMRSHYITKKRIALRGDSATMMRISLTDFSIKSSEKID